MWKIAEQIRTAIATLQLPAMRIPGQDAEMIRERIFSKYSSHIHGGALWERLAEVVSIQDANAWRWIGNYVGDDPGILFFNLEDEPAMFEFAHRRDIVAVLAECTGFEFYVTNTELTFLLCFNHHDFLIAAGDARPWLLSRTELVLP